jgi:hypothetical protein
MKGRVRIEDEGTSYERAFDIENENDARTTLKEIITDVDERFIKTSRREPSATRRKPVIKPAEATSAEAGGEL